MAVLYDSPKLYPPNAAFRFPIFLAVSEISSTPSNVFRIETPCLGTEIGVRKYVGQLELIPLPEQADWRLPGSLRNVPKKSST
jgi:hypothetical protein